MSGPQTLRPTAPRSIVSAPRWPPPPNAACSLLLIAAALIAIVFVLVQLRLVVLPVIAAVFLATALTPIARWLRAHRWPAALAALTTMGMTAAVFAAVMAAIVPAIAAEIDELGASARAGLDEALTCSSFSRTATAYGAGSYNSPPRHDAATSTRSADAPGRLSAATCAGSASSP